MQNNYSAFTIIQDRTGALHRVRLVRILPIRTREYTYIRDVLPQFIG